MVAATFDTLEYANKLKATGFTPEQTEALILCVETSQRHLLELSEAITAQTQALTQHVIASQKQYQEISAAVLAQAQASSRLIEYNHTQQEEQSRYLAQIIENNERQRTETQASVIFEVPEANRHELSTKGDLSVLKNELKSDIEAHRQGLSTKSDLSILKNELKSDIAALKWNTAAVIAIVGLVMVIAWWLA
ncbi:MAG: CCDC90 family protein [Azoarcus sp.]|jgi:Flp pilus assembly protein TadB|nr:CCDC90 family protein [Azoarcus sp.]